MSKSGIFTANTSAQTVADGGTINLGTTIRRYGANITSSGTAITIDGFGYFNINAVVTVTPTSAGTVSITAYKDGSVISGATASATAEASQTITMPIVGMFKKICPCIENESNITFVLNGASTVSNIAVTVETV